jgi:hypothetical protein
MSLLLAQLVVGTLAMSLLFAAGVCDGKYIYICIYIDVCVCERERERESVCLYIYIYIYIHIHIYRRVCVCVSACVCVCVCVSACVCVCVCEYTAIDTERKTLISNTKFINLNTHKRKSIYIYIKYKTLYQTLNS